jgi:hypothetical protein
VSLDLDVAVVNSTPATNRQPGLILPECDDLSSRCRVGAQNRMTGNTHYAGGNP